MSVVRLIGQCLLLGCLALSCSPPGRPSGGYACDLEHFCIAEDRCVEGFCQPREAPGSVVAARGTCPSAHWCFDQPAAERSANSLQSVFGGSPADLWVTGADGSLQHWDGKIWASVAGAFSVSPGQGGTGGWFVSSSDVSVVTAAGKIARWDGSQWALSYAGTGKPLRALWGAVRDEAWAVGEQGTLLRWNGTLWATAPLPSSSTFFGIWGSSLDDIWLCGEGGLLLHRQAGGWASIASPTSATLRALWGRSRNDVWAVGDNVVLHFDGSTWTQVFTPGPEPPGCLGHGGGRGLRGGQQWQRSPLGWNSVVHRSDLGGRHGAAFGFRLLRQRALGHR
jgi:hypothetical protein